VSSIVGLTPGGQISKIIGMGVCDEIVFDLVELIFVVLVLIFVLINFGFDIEELVAAFAATFSAMTL